MTATTQKKIAAFMTALRPGATLAAIKGSERLARTEAIKKLCNYIKARELQNPANRLNNLCDDASRAVLGKDEVTLFEMTGLASRQLAPA